MFGKVLQTVLWMEIYNNIACNVYFNIKILFKQGLGEGVLEND